MTGIARSRRNNFSRLLLRSNHRLISRAWLSQASSLPESAPPTSNSPLTRRCDRFDRSSVKLSFLARIRRALGLSIDSNANPTQSVPISREERRQNNNDITFIRSCLGLTKGTLLPPIHTGHPKSTILLSIDTERDATSTTEIGLTFLDTLDLRNLHPGPKALNWCSHFQPHHFSLKPSGSFLFGTSTLLPVPGLSSHVSSLLDPQRKYILIGHSLRGDLDRFSKLTGINIRKLPNVVAEIDTHTLIRADKRIPQTLSGLWQHLGAPASETLESLCPAAAFEPGGFRFHNAGNDAVYNLHALLMLAVTPRYAWVPEMSRWGLGIQAVGRYVQAFLSWFFETKGRSLGPLPVGAMLRRPRGLALRQPRQMGGRGVTLRFTREVGDGGL